MTKPNYELLKHAYAIIDGIPDHRFNLNKVATNDTDHGECNVPTDCGTIACGIGWLAMHPDFIDRGLTVDKQGAPRLHGATCFYEDAGAHLFGITCSEAMSLFSPNGYSYLDVPNEGYSHRTHKQVFQNRVRLFLQQKGQL
jgi:hypothetical protein